MMKKTIKHAVALAAAVMTAFSAFAEGDIISIDALKGPAYSALIGGKTFPNPDDPLLIGHTLTIRVRLANANRDESGKIDSPNVCSWELVNPSGVPLEDAITKPCLGLSVGGNLRWAELVKFEATKTKERFLTDLIFQYTVKPGDLALPLKLMGSLYSEFAEGDNYLIYMPAGWRIQNILDEGQTEADRRTPDFKYCSDSVLRYFRQFGQYPVASQVDDETGSPTNDKTLSNAGIYVKTIDFDSLYDSLTSDFNIWRTIHSGSTKAVRNGSPTIVLDAKADYGENGYATVYVWTEDDSLLTPIEGGKVKNIKTYNVRGEDRRVAEVVIATGDTAAPFNLLARGPEGTPPVQVFMSSAPTNVYVETTGELEKNTVSRFVAIGPELQPNISVMFGDSDTGSAVADTQYRTSATEMRIVLSEAFEEPVTVTLKPVLKDGEGNDVDVYARHIIGTALSSSSTEAWLKNERVVTFQAGEVEKPLYVFALGSSVKAVDTGIEFQIESVEPEAAAARFAADFRFPGKLNIKPQDEPFAYATENYAFDENKERTVEIEVEDGYRNTRSAADAAGITAGGDDLWKVVWDPKDGASAPIMKTGLVPEPKDGDPDVWVLKVPGIIYPVANNGNDDNYESVVKVTSPDRKTVEIRVTAHVDPPRAVYGTPTGRDPVEGGSAYPYNEGEPATVKVELTKIDTDRTLYAFFEPLNEAAVNCLSCVNAAEDGNEGIEVPKGSKTGSVPMKIDVLDGDATATFRIVLSDTKEWNAAASQAVMQDYGTRIVQFDCANVLPVGTGLQIGSGSAGYVENGGEITERQIAIETPVKMKLYVKDVFADLQLPLVPLDDDGAVADFDATWQKWLAGQDDDPDVQALEQAGVFLSLWEFDDGSEFLFGTRNGVAEMTHSFSYPGRQTIKVKMLDKDTIKDYLSKKNKSRATLMDDLENPNSGLVWGPEFVFTVTVSTEPPGIKITPRNEYGFTGGATSRTYIWNEDQSGRDFGFDIGFLNDESTPVDARIKVTLERTIDGTGMQISELGTLSLKNDSGTVVMTEDNPNPADRVIYVNIPKNKRAAASGQVLQFAAGKIDGTQYSEYVLRAEIDPDSTGMVDGIPLGDYFKPAELRFRIENKAPYLRSVTKLGFAGGTPTTNVVSVARGEQIVVGWSVADFVSYDQGEGSGLTVTWSSSSGGNQTTVGPVTGTFTTSFESGQDQWIRCDVEDKDGGLNDGGKTYIWYFSVEISKALHVYTIGPRASAINDVTADYVQASGIGVGVAETDSTGGDISGFDQNWSYNVDKGSATIWARGLRAGEADTSLRRNVARTWWVDQYGDRTKEQAEAYVNPDTELDSFFYAAYNQVPQDDGTFEAKLGKFEPVVGKATALAETTYITVSLPKKEKDALAYDERHIEIIYSKEWSEHPMDNCGDINQDGIPDVDVKEFGMGVYTKGSPGAFTAVGADLDSLADFNEDADYLPNKGASGNTIMPNIQDSWTSEKNEFSAFLERRGFGPGLNRGYRNADGSYPDPEYSLNEKRAWLLFREKETLDALANMSEADVDALFTDNIEEARNDLMTGAWTPERPTDPTKEDTDRDGLPDGYEYWFWYGARVGYEKDGKWQGPMKGRKLTLNDLESFIEIPSEDICKAFDPQNRNDFMSSRDFDGDGLTDLEELAIGTNPVDYDTDGGKVSDGYETMWGLNPIDAKDDWSEKRGESNPDGDYMAYAPASATRTVTFSVRGPLGDTTYYMYLATYVDEETKTFDGSLLSTSSSEITVDSVTRSFNGERIPRSVQDRRTVSYEGVEDFSVGSSGIVLYHDQVYSVFGFDPRTAWMSRSDGKVASRWELIDGVAKNTRELKTRDEYFWGKYHGIKDGNSVLGRLLASCTNPNKTFEKTYGDWQATVSVPSRHGADTSGDGCPDGWVMYVGQDPLVEWGNKEGSDSDKDGLTGAAEYAGTDSTAAYSEVDSIKGVSSWPNKFWPTDPKDSDTDGDGIADGKEKEFHYRTVSKPSEAGGTCFRGGGMNPCTADTDGDNLPDPWEKLYCGTTVSTNKTQNLKYFNDTYLSASANVDNNLRIADGVDTKDYDEHIEKGNWKPYITGGMDPTYKGDSFTSVITRDDATGTVRDFDFDGDGLENFQEYLVQSVRCWRYDDTVTPLNGRAIVWNAGGTSVSTPIEDANLVMDPLNRRAFFEKVKESPLWETCYAGVSYFDNLVEFDYKRLGYFAPADRPWDPMRSGSLSSESSYGEKPGDGFCYMRPPDCLIDASARSWVQADQYVSTDPRKRDTDGDGMDDYWEIYHGLSPILGSTTSDDIIAQAYGVTINEDGTVHYKLDAVSPDLDGHNGNVWSKASGGFAYDPSVQPWTLGTPDADPDGDGLRNRDECITGNITSPSTSHTDPTPLWMTDTSSMRSVPSQYYYYYTYPDDILNTTLLDYFTGLSISYRDESGYASGREQIASSQSLLGNTESSKFYLFSFERNEGYDTDGDWRCDGHEQTRLALPASDALNPCDPDRRAALYLPGSDSCAYSFTESFIPNSAYDAFRQFTVECWVKPEDLSREQTVVERGYSYPGANLVNDAAVWRVNFRIFIDASGHARGMFDGDCAVESGVVGQGSAFVDGGELQKNEWVHLAMTYDGKKLSFYVNGQSRDVANTSIIPANGVYAMMQTPSVTNGYPSSSYKTYAGANVVGAHRRVVHFAWRDTEDPKTGETRTADFSQFNQYLKGWVSEVRFWDGARTAAEVQGSYMKRMSFEDVAANRKAVFDAFKSRGSRNDNDGRLMLPASLRVLFNFQQIPAAANPGDISQLPSGFAQGVIANSGMSAADTEIVWWKSSPLMSTVYADAHVVPRIQNVVEHLPLLDGSFADSMYWSEKWAGNMSASTHGVESYAIPNGGYPYGDSYYLNERSLAFWRIELREKALYGDRFHENYTYEGEEDMTIQPDFLDDMYAFDNSCRFSGLSDLVPLGGAYARLDPDFWDAQGVSTVWTDTGDDTDGDNLPDWWEAYAASHHGAPGSDEFNTSTTVKYNGDDNMEMPAYEAYLRDLAAGLQPPGSVNPEFASNSIDIDGDGLVDWWQNIYGLKSGATGDDDGDGLANYLEYVLAEVFKVGRFSPINPFSMSQYVSDYFYRVGQSYIGEIFTDHDMIDDLWEDGFESAYVSRYLSDGASDPDGDGWSNFAEFQVYRNPKVTVIRGIDGSIMDEYPVPLIKANVVYEGSQAIAEKPLVFQAWHRRGVGDLSPESIPDAVWTVGGENKDSSSERIIGKNPNRMLTTYLSPGNPEVGSVEITFKDINWKFLYMGAYYATATAPIWRGFAKDVQRSDNPQKGDIIWSIGSSNQVIGEIDYLSGALTIDFAAVANRRVCVWRDSKGVWHVGDADDWYTNHDSVYVSNIADSYIKFTWKSSPTPVSARTTYYLAKADDRTASNNARNHVVEGISTFVAFFDLDGNGKYTAGEPYGVAPDVNVSWNEASFDMELTDTSPVSARFSVSSSVASDRAVFWGKENPDITDIPLAGNLSGGRFQRIRVQRCLINGMPCADYGVPAREILDKTLDLENDVYLTEADFLGGGNYDIDWEFLADDLSRGNVNLPSVIGDITYRVVLGDDRPEYAETNNVLNYAFTRKFDSPDAYHSIASPRAIADGVVVTPSPTFTWTITNSLSSYTAFEIRVADDSGKEVWASGIQPMPPKVRDSDYAWRYTWTAPIFADSYTPDGKKLFEDNKTYSWRISVLNSLYRNDGNFSKSVPFRMNVVTNALDNGTVNVAVRYFGPDAVRTSGRIRVQAFTTPDFNGMPVGEGCVMDVATVADSERVTVANAKIIGLDAGTYYIRAFIDTEADGKCARWESQGFACQRDMPGCAIYRPVSVTVGPKFGAGETVKVYIDDIDTDRDNLPDAWEWTQKGSLTALNVTALDQDIAGGVSVKKSLSATFSPDGPLTPGLATRLGSAINSAYAAAMMLGVDVSGAESAEEAAAAVAGAVAASAEPKRVRFTAISLDVPSRSVRLGVSAEAEGGVASGALAHVFYEFDETGTLTVRMRLWHKDALGGDWEEIEGAARDVTIGEGDERIELPLGDDVQLGSGFFRVTIEGK